MYERGKANGCNEKLLQSISTEIPLRVILLVLGALVASEYTAIIETSSGPVQGEILTTFNSIKYAAFKGIRYGQPPVGTLRFQPPLPAIPWTTTQQALQHGNKCPQLDVDSEIIGDEDCLFLNVFTPTTNLIETPTKLKPVMVWIHEGTFAEGSGDVSIKKPDFLLMRDVLFVSLNYRLGALGFLSLDESRATGNQGLKDQNLALKWVQTNIAKFGGNPNKVTIFGKGAGAVSVGFHVLSRASEGLFHGAISMSGTPLAPHSWVSRAEAARRGSMLADMVREEMLLKKDGWELIAVHDANLEKLLKKARSVDPIAPFVPTIEDPRVATSVFLSENVKDIYASGNYNKVPQILGSTYWDISAYFNFIMETIEANIESLSTTANSDSLRTEIVHWFDRGGKVSSFAIDPADNMLFFDPVSETRRMLLDNFRANRVYHYNMNFLPYDDLAARPKAIGEIINVNNALYAKDLYNIFYIPSKYSYPSDRPEIDRMIDTVCGLWTNFAKYGDPTPDIGSEDMGNWPASNLSGPTLKIQLDLSLRLDEESMFVYCIKHERVGQLCLYLEI